jgi:hypothetical protein
LPGNRDILVVAAKADVGTVAVTNFDGLVVGEAERAGSSEAGADLLGGELRHTAEARDAAPPEIAIKRDPGALSEVVAKVASSDPTGSWVLGPGAGPANAVEFVV